MKVNTLLSIPAFQALYIADIKAKLAFEYTVVRLDIHLTHIDAKVIGNDICQVDEHTHTVNAPNLDCHQR